MTFDFLFSIKGREYKHKFSKTGYSLALGASQNFYINSKKSEVSKYLNRNFIKYQNK